jgi:hypothetical protein
MLLTSTFSAQTGTAFAAYADRQRAVSGTAQPWAALSGGPGSPPHTGRRPGICGCRVGQRVWSCPAPPATVKPAAIPAPLGSSGPDTRQPASTAEPPRRPPCTRTLAPDNEHQGQRPAAVVAATASPPHGSATRHQGAAPRGDGRLVPRRATAVSVVQAPPDGSGDELRDPPDGRAAGALDIRRLAAEPAATPGRHKPARARCMAPPGRADDLPPPAARPLCGAARGRGLQPRPRSTPSPVACPAAERPSSRPEPALLAAAAAVLPDQARAANGPSSKPNPGQGDIRGTNAAIARKQPQKEATRT